MFEQKHALFFGDQLVLLNNNFLHPRDLNLIILGAIKRQWQPSGFECVCHKFFILNYFTPCICYWFWNKKSKVRSWEFLHCTPLLKLFVLFFQQCSKLCGISEAGLGASFCEKYCKRLIETRKKKRENVICRLLHVQSLKPEKFHFHCSTPWISCSIREKTKLIGAIMHDIE